MCVVWHGRRRTVFSPLLFFIPDGKVTTRLTLFRFQLSYVLHTLWRCCRSPLPFRFPPHPALDARTEGISFPGRRWRKILVGRALRADCELYVYRPLFVAATITAYTTSTWPCCIARIEEKNKSSESIDPEIFSRRRSRRPRRRRRLLLFVVVALCPYFSSSSAYTGRPGILLTAGLLAWLVSF